MIDYAWKIANNFMPNASTKVIAYVIETDYLGREYYGASVIMVTSITSIAD
jgi:hypothetical protein